MGTDPEELELTVSQFGYPSALAALASMAPTGGGTLACAGATGVGAPVCAVVGGAALTAEAAIAALGTVVVVHGGAVVGHNAFASTTPNGGTGNRLPNGLTLEEWAQRKPEIATRINTDGTRIEYEVRNTPGRDGGWSRITRIRDQDGNTIKVIHEAWEGSSNPRIDPPDHLDIKFER